MKTANGIALSVFLLLGATLPIMAQDPPEVILLCGDDTTSNPAAADYCVLVSGFGPDAERAGRLHIEEASLGLKKPTCDNSNCGVSQNCTGGSQINSGTITWDYRVIGSFTKVTATVSAGTVTQQHCSDCQ